MLKRLFSTTTEIQKTFEECRVDKTHQMCHPKRFVDLADRIFNENKRENNHVNINISLANVVSKEINISINNQRNKKNTKKDEFIKILLKKIRSENEVVKIKGLILAHSIVKKVNCSQFIEVLLEEVDQYIVQDGSNHKISITQHEIDIHLENSRSQFIKKNIISFYCQYIKKYLINLESVLFVGKYNNGLRSESPNIIELLNIGFIILNLVNYILRSQYTFNKMGRYYIQHKEILGLFTMYLSDIISYNDYIKSMTNFSVNSIKNASNEQMNHFFLFITEAQKTSDRLYEFFYNRYYYKEVKNLIDMPKFLSIQTDQFDKLVNYVKKRDKQLVILVKRSKYDSRSKSCYTHTGRSESLSKSDLSKTNKSECLDTSLEESNIFEYIDEQKKDKNFHTPKKERKIDVKRSLTSYKS